ncbi:hypothetical protein K437DRAFT_292359 [Tilletiaria anomala UBC 951]|uniref:VPS9 domain-containing protein n=1 Tax=Tilletiaria anomala (strain ATCC 24038 / CBS 436.72 / UBC 951) TaxID=1037660 RepID=A0A066WI10_TILAU|nr:uncharacterized protein K437DRAFT_292359 [Tilletiaria anomala UBC 951]KDN53441.1 hypothetical protein K437DRAFT_292359 [Tilletiaria anomala UBC 951]
MQQSDDDGLLHSPTYPSHRVRTTSNSSHASINSHSSASGANNPNAKVQVVTPGSSYEGLAYAPRQRLRPPPPPQQASSSPIHGSSGLKQAHRAFQSHSSLFQAQQQEAVIRNHHAHTSSLPPDPILTRPGSANISTLDAQSSPRSPTLAAAPVVISDKSNLALLPHSVSSGSLSTGDSGSLSAKSRLLVQEMKGRAQQLGLLPDSIGWQMIEKLQSLGTHDSEWGRLLDLAGNGQCTLMLPRQMAPARTSSNDVTLAMIHDHILLHPLPSRPSPTSLSTQSQVATLSGLRADYATEPNLAVGEACESKLTFKSFIARPESSLVSELWHERTRAEFLRNLPPLSAATEAHGESSAAAQPRVKLLSFEEAFFIPSSVQRRRRQSAQKPRPSSTFASLFVGSGRAKQTDGDRDGVRDNVNMLAKSSSTTPDETYEEDVVGPERTIAIWVVDRYIQRSQMLTHIGKAMQTRLIEKMNAVGIDPSIVDVACSFAVMFLPPKQAPRGLGFDSAISPGLQRSPTMPFLAASSAPYLAGPDELAENFQSFYSGIYAQLQSQIDTQQDAGVENVDAQAAVSPNTEARIKKWIQVVETCVCEEVYDRIFTPFSSRDCFLDIALSSRIAALNLLGLTLAHLDLVLPAKDSPSGRHIHKGLARITQDCGEVLYQLNSPSNQSPASKLDILTAAHKTIVDGIRSLPAITLKDDDGKPEESQPPSSSEQPSTEGDEATLTVIEDEQPKSRSTDSGAASADLILPLLIYSIVRSNPLGLASHLLFIQRYRADCLLSGESSYCLVNMQAAVAFIENVEPSALGFEGVTSDMLPSGDVPEAALHSRQDSAGAVETLASPSMEHMSISDRVRTRLATDFGEIAGVSNKTITSVLGSSLSAFGRIMGGNNQGQSLATSEKESQEGVAGTAPSAGGARDTAVGGDAGEGPRLRTRSTAREEDERSIRSVGAMRIKRQGIEYEGQEEQVKEQSIGQSTSESSKVSLSERLASIPMLGRLGMSERTQSGNSPLSVTRELPGPPPPPQKAPTAQDRIPASLRSPYAPLEQPPRSTRPLHIVVAATGSVASIKIPLIVEQLLQYANVRVQLLATKSSLHFFKREGLAALGGMREDYQVKDLAAENQAAVRGTGEALTNLPRVQLWTDEDEWDQWSKVGDPILHIELRRWADIVLVAPCSADTLAKINGGICDNLLTSFLRALSPMTPILLFPAMNTLMWLHPLTARHIAFVREFLGYEVIGPIEKKLACGDMGQGAMYEWTDIVDLVAKRFGLVLQEGQVNGAPATSDSQPQTPSAAIAFEST